jgi:hypothetical protein
MHLGYIVLHEIIVSRDAADPGIMVSVEALEAWAGVPAQRQRSTSSRPASTTRSRR